MFDLLIQYYLWGVFFFQTDIYKCILDLSFLSLVVYFCVPFFFFRCECVLMGVLSCVCLCVGVCVLSFYLFVNVCMYVFKCCVMFVL